MNLKVGDEVWVKFKVTDKEEHLFTVGTNNGLNPTITDEINSTYTLKADCKGTKSFHVGGELVDSMDENESIELVE